MHSIITNLDIPVQDLTKIRTIKEGNNKHTRITTSWIPKLSAGADDLAKHVYTRQTHAGICYCSLANYALNIGPKEVGSSHHQRPGF